MNRSAKHRRHENYGHIQAPCRHYIESSQNCKEITKKLTLNRRLFRPYFTLTTLRTRRFLPNLIFTLFIFLPSRTRNLRRPTRSLQIRLRPTRTPMRILLRPAYFRTCLWWLFITPYPRPVERTTKYIKQFVFVIHRRVLVTQKVFCMCIRFQIRKGTICTSCWYWKEKCIRHEI